MTVRSLARQLSGKSIIRTMLFSYLGVNLLLLFALGFVAIRDSSSTMTKQITAARNEVMEQAARGFDLHLEEVKRPLIQYAVHHSVVTLMSRAGSMSVEERIRHERSIGELSAGVTSLQSLISDVLILGSNGYVNNLDNRKSLHWNYPFQEQSWFREAVSSIPSKGFIPLSLHIQDYYVDTYLSKQNQPTLSISIPVKGYSQQVIGTVIANLDLQKVNALFERDRRIGDETTFMLDKEHVVIAHPNPQKIGSTLRFAGDENVFAKMSGSFVSEMEGQETLILFHPSSLEGLRLVSTVPMEQIRAQTGPLKAKLAQFLYLCLLLNTLLSVMITVRITKPFSRLLHAIDRLGEDSLYVVPKRYRYRELNLIGNKFKELVGRIEQLVKQNYVSQIAVRDARLKALQAQMNPHFLFNTLQLLQTEIVCGSAEQSNQLLLSLSNLLRYSLHAGDPLVMLSEELRNAEDYLFIMNKTFDERISIQVDVEDPAALRCHAVKLMLQPVLENALIHAFRENPREAAIRISVSKGRKGVLVAIADNGAGIEKGRLAWLKARLRAVETDQDKLDPVYEWNSQRDKGGRRIGEADAGEAGGAVWGGAPPATGTASEVPEQPATGTAAEVPAPPAAGTASEVPARPATDAAAQGTSLRESIGLANVHQRIQLHFGASYGVRVRSRQGRGTIVYLLLPHPALTHEEGCS
ncbi:cache domain-containing sensor histidine kinase [Paenibacillus turpanensis]|uniref:cache domain-containing sensor histidine kinase n=1 Tax=Paenibacillus turpanensis TaxID=2689078 RepID=UPI00140A6CF2|nr:histidine kinase [Paenibacillus turpanensis]